MSNATTRRQGIFWILTIPADGWSSPTELPSHCQWIRGQKEIGNNTGYTHWQVCLALKKKASLAGIKKLYPTAHAELSRSQNASEYVWKEDTRVPDTQFEYGQKPIRRNSSIDWETVWESAKSGSIQDVPAQIRVVHYRTLLSIASDYEPVHGMERTCHVFWGTTGTGKSRTAWTRYPDAYSKDPRTKFWCGYRSQSNVIIGNK